MQIMALEHKSPVERFTAPYRVGIIATEEKFCQHLIENLNQRPDIEAEWCKASELHLSEPSPYRVIVDRLSHCFEFYQPYLKHAVLSGTYVINNPFWFLADDKFFNYHRAAQLGVAVPKTVLLPSREYDERVLRPEDLHNLKGPIDWEEVTREIGFPAILKPYDGYGWREVHRVDSIPELLAVYNESMMDVMMLQEFIDFESYVRCFVVGRRWVLITRYNPEERRYIVDHEFLSPELEARITHDCRVINQALGYDINTVEFAIRDGIPYAIDFMNPIPDAKPEVISQPYFCWLVEHVAELIEEVILTQAVTPYSMAKHHPRPNVPLDSSSAEEIRRSNGQKEHELPHRRGRFWGGFL